MNTNLRERGEYGPQTRIAPRAPRLPPLEFPEPTRHAVARRHRAHAAAQEVGGIAELMLMMWFQVVATIVWFVFLLIFGPQHAPHGKDDCPPP